MERSREQVMIDEIMDWFNFAKVAETMKAIEWRIHYDQRYEIPDENILREHARDVLMEAIDSSEKYEEDYVYVRIGPFKATCFRIDNKIDRLLLEFVVTEWESDVE
jgi:hypothetical protein